MRKLLVLALLLLTASPISNARDKMTDAFKQLGDTLSALALKHFEVKSKIEVSKVMRRGKEVDIYFGITLADYPWRSRDTKWFRGTLQTLWPGEYGGYTLGEVFCRDFRLEELSAPIRFKGNVKGTPFIRETGKKKPSKGLYGRNIALWQSHGLYFDGNFWSWQRTPIFRTVEDLHTQNYVLPFLIPMLENAGAYILDPRERDTQVREAVCDNDPFYSADTTRYASSLWAEAFPEPLPERTHGAYIETGAWKNAGKGFADFKRNYLEGDNPFAEGTARQISCVKGKGRAFAKWTPSIEERGLYAVYISYRSLPESSPVARYRVRHLGGESEFLVDQRKGGGTWIYLGSFEFDKGNGGYVVLDNGTGSESAAGKVVSADAVRFGGGTGKYACSAASDSSVSISGMPAYTEGALYSMRYGGAPESLWDKWEGDYTRDYAGRGAWVKWLKKDLGIPIDLSLAFHTDAGTSPNDSIVGTLAIYTLKEKGSRKFTHGQERMASRRLADFVQSEVTSALKHDYDTLWRRRGLWDRSYSEARTTDVPGMILELLSHQNFADMLYGSDPQFRFDVSRAVYKGILKFLSAYYGVEYVVEPLPIKDFASEFQGSDKVRLSWKGVSDPREPGAEPTFYTVYERTDGGGWKRVFETAHNFALLPIEPGRIYSYKVVAGNEGGSSFPSEILSVGKAPESKGKVLIINNFTRVGAPSFFVGADYAGFDDGLDGGVPWGSESGFIGEDYEHRRGSPYQGNNSPGFGGSDYYFAGRTYAGNTFDYPYRHGKALLGLGYSFCSASSGSLDSARAASAKDYDALDIICGKQVSTITGSGLGGVKHRVYPENLRDFIISAAGQGVNIIISGAYIASEGFDTVYPIKEEGFAAYQKEVRDFIGKVLGIKRISGRASRDGIILPLDGGSALQFYNTKNKDFYCVENPDGIRPASADGKLVLKYRSSNVGAGVFFDANNYKSASYGFPAECLQKEEDIAAVLGGALGFFEGK